MSHTKGPWKHALAIIENSPSKWVVTVGKWGAPNLAIVDDEANARLIAAAPELLAYVEMVLNEQLAHGEKYGDPIYISMAQELIHKIRGES